MKSLILILCFFCLQASAQTANTDLGKVLLRIKNKKVSCFVNRIYKDAKIVESKYGVPVALTIGIAIFETGFGESKRCKEDCNFFGLRRKGKYCKYNSRLECFHHFGRTMTQSCYDNLRPTILAEWYNALNCCKYATGEKYNRELNNIIFCYHLDILI